MVVIVGVVGRSGSGKTVVVEYLINQFFLEGYNVGAVKHVHHRGFTVDTEGKNTWRFAKAGAKMVMAVSPDEVAIIKKTSIEETDLDYVQSFFERDQVDVLFIEGYHELVSKRGDMLKILTAKDGPGLQEILEAGVVEPVLAVSGLITKGHKERFEGQMYPFIRIPEDGKQLVDLIKQRCKLEDRIKRE
jgi:molybdopterin-guanine dinucleotide biosynthesis protein MobB